MEASICMGALIVCAVEDIRKKTLSLRLLLVCGSAMVVASCFFGNIGVGARLCGAGIGLALMVLSAVTRGQIGRGDGILFCMTGLASGFSANLLMLLYAVLGAGLFSAVMLAAGKVGRKDRLPFVPFAAVGYLGVILTYAQRV